MQWRLNLLPVMGVSWIEGFSTQDTKARRGTAMTPPTDDRALVQRIAAGDQEGLRALYAAYQARLWAYLWYALGGDTGLVEEILQDIFVAIWRSANNFQGQSQVATWIFQIAHNLAANARRSRVRHHSGFSAPSMNDDPNNEADMAYEDAVILRLDLAEAIQQLSPLHQAVLHLFFYQGFTVNEIAQIMNVPAGTVKSRLSYARRALGKALEMDGERR